MNSAVVSRPSARAATSSSQQSINSNKLELSISRYIESDIAFRGQCEYYKRRLSNLETLVATKNAIDRVEQCKSTYAWTSARIEQLEEAQRELSKKHPELGAVVYALNSNMEWFFIPRADELRADIQHRLAAMYKERENSTRHLAQQQVRLAKCIDTLTALHPRLDRINLSLTDAAHINIWLTESHRDVQRLKNGLVQSIQIHLSTKPSGERHHKPSDHNDPDSRQNSASLQAIEEVLVRVLSRND